MNFLELAYDQGVFRAALFLVAAAAFAQAPRPLGELIDVGGYRVHLYCTGQGSPTVMITGAGFSFDWGLVQPHVAKFTRVCTYDVSGTAWSEPGPASTCTARVQEIHTLLEKANVHGPFVLAGLSIGALVARLYAHEYPKDVAGMVIIDHAFLDPEPARPKPQPNPRSDGVTPPVLILQTPIEPSVEDISHFEKLPEQDRKLHRWAMSLNPAMPTVEMARECAAQVGLTLGSMPLAVVSTGNRDAAYLRLQQQLLGLSRKNTHRVADQSIHAVEIDQPDVVIAAIRDVVDAARATLPRPLR